MDFYDYYFRSSSVQAFIEDVKSELNDAGIDPYGVGVLHVTHEGDDELDSGVFAYRDAGRWHKIAPTQDDPGTVAGYAIINARTTSQRLSKFVEGYGASDPKTAPPDVPEEEKIGGDTHRITEPDNPELSWL
jgi:hypothetical protein